MFTGLIEEIGTIKAIIRNKGSINISVQADKVFDDLKIDDSIAINGVCQTVVGIKDKTFTVTAVEETLKKTGLGNLKAGGRVNLERALRLCDRLGGHLVQGHVDCTGKVSKIQKLQTAVMMTIAFDAKYNKYNIKSGSVCIDGTSLTIAEIAYSTLTVSIIPHSWDNTMLSEYTVGREVNLEFDMIAKYLEKLIIDGDFEKNIQLSDIRQGNTDIKGNRSILSQYIDQPEY